MSSKQAIKTHFDYLSSSYSENFSLEKSGRNYDFRKRLNIVVQEIQIESGSLLDCACGTGEITLQVLKSSNFSTAVICDISQDMLSIANDLIAKEIKTSSISYREIDIFKYKPSTDLKFDIILCLGLIAHVGSLDDLLMHLKLMLSKSGKIILQSSLLDHFGVKLTKLLTAKRFTKKNGYHISYFSKKMIEECVLRNNLKINNVRRYNIGIPFGDRISKNANYWVEKKLADIANICGSDAIFVISHA